MEREGSNGAYSVFTPLIRFSVCERRVCFILWLLFYISSQNVNSDMELCADPFRVFPAHFEVDKKELVEVDVTFFPKERGLHLETLFLLCSNNTCQQLDFTGDGLNFERSLIEIKVVHDYFKW